MNNKKFILTVISALTLLSASTSAFAKEFSYDYIQAGIGTSNHTAYDREHYVATSKSINNNISAIGTIYYLYGDWNASGNRKEQKVDAYALEGVYHKQVAPNTDLLTSIQYSHSSFKLNCTPTTGVCYTYSDASPSFDHYSLGAGLKHKIQNDVEVEGRYSLVKTKWTSATSTTRQASLSLMKEIFNKTSIGVEYAWGLSGSEIDHYGVFIRKNF
jgi:hypothetical protein